DGYLDEIHSLRNEYQADVCVLIVDSLLGVNGLAASIGAEYSTAFFVVTASAAFDDLSFPHELGHLLGCRHDNDIDILPYSNARGYNWFGKLLEYSNNLKKYKTIMSIKEGSDLRVPYFSNPYVYDDTLNQMGTLTYNYAAYAIDDYSSTIAAFQPRYTTSGTISVNEWWRGTLNITGNVTVNSGVKLTIEPNAVINFANGASLIVNGELVINGGELTSSGTWGGIQFNSGSSGNIYNCIITNATNGIYCYNSSPTIRNSILEYNTTGLSCSYYSSPVLRLNSFRYNSINGISCYSNSSPDLGEDENSGSNAIRNNLIGLKTSYNSNPDLHGYMVYGNSIFDNTGNEIEATYYCTINADKVFWGNGATIFTYSSTVTNTNPLQYNPNPFQSIAEQTKPVNILSKIETINTEEPKENLSQALELQRQKRFDEAIPLFLEVFNKNKEELIGKYALTKIEECFTQSRRKDYFAFSEKEIKPNITKGNETYVIALELEAHQMINAGEYSKAINNLTTILTKYNLNEYIEKNTLFTLGSFYTLFTENKRDADNYFNSLKTKYPEDYLTSQIEIIKKMGESYVGNKKLILPNPEIKSESVNNNEEIIISNYPNPFNPTTTIEYNLPTEDNVKLEVYNSLGQLINVLVEGEQSAGKQRITWNGKDSFGNSVASGIYFYRIKTNSFSQIRKMILLK
ncbi:MAG: T9SS type A sorting domain-containing protein, partial [Melioribacteraceae bacterium]|nr:T9SS type A sorting domain-containing protein [Melioribacteraceae bacterium]